MCEEMQTDTGASYSVSATSKARAMIAALSQITFLYQR